MACQPTLSDKSRAGKKRFFITSQQKACTDSRGNIGCMDIMNILRSVVGFLLGLS